MARSLGLRIVRPGSVAPAIFANLTRHFARSRVAQLAEHPTVNRTVTGSSPVAGASKFAGQRRAVELTTRLGRQPVDTVRGCTVRVLRFASVERGTANDRGCRQQRGTGGLYVVPLGVAR
jgi:hypothetical protein